jgi:uncharacterized protein YcbK (DUF882 family)
MKPFRALQSHTKLIYRSLLLVISLIVLLPGISMPSSEPTRFFRLGDGQIHIKNEKDGRVAKVNLFDPKGTFHEKALKEIDDVFNFPNTSKGEHISLRLLFLLDYFSDIIAPGKIIHLVSGYRSPSYNEKLKKSGGNVAKTSTHIDGMAIDFFIEGIDGKILWEAIRKENCCGIGHYGGKVVHLDSGKPRFWEAATSKVGAQESEFNRRVYLSTEYDRYKRGERVRFFLTSVSDFQFGIQKMATLVNDFEEKNRQVTLSVQTQPEEECSVINNRTASRFIYGTFPVETEPGRYRVRLDFCKKPFEQMPSMIFSNEIEIVRD